MVENYAFPGAIDRMGFPWEKIQQIQSADGLRLGQGIRAGSF